MAGFEAVVAEIEASAAGMTAAGETVGAADPTADLKGVGSALEGGLSPAAATTLVSAWTKRFSTWSTDAEKHATARRNSSTSYSRADHEASQRMQLTAAGSRGPMMHRDQ